MRYNGILGGQVLSYWKQSIWASKDTFHCAKHNQHALHANARGSGGIPPQKNFENRCSEIY